MDFVRFLQRELTDDAKAKAAEADLKEIAALVPPSAYAAAQTGRVAIGALRVASGVVSIFGGMIAGAVAMMAAADHFHSLPAMVAAFITASSTVMAGSLILLGRLSSALRVKVARAAIGSVDRHLRAELPAQSHGGSVAVPAALASSPQRPLKRR